MATTGKPALHAVHDQRLRELMHELSRLAVDRLPQEVDSAPQRRRRLGEVAAVADALADDARAIPVVLRDVRIGPRDRRLFEAYAAKLEAQARELAELARTHEAPPVEGMLDEMLTTCTACHSSFRILPVVR